MGEGFYDPIPGRPDNLTHLMADLTTPKKRGNRLQVRLEQRLDDCWYFVFRRSGNIIAESRGTQSKVSCKKSLTRFMASVSAESYEWKPDYADS